MDSVQDYLGGFSSWRGWNFWCKQNIKILGSDWTSRSINHVLWQLNLSKWSIFHLLKKMQFYEQTETNPWMCGLVFVQQTCGPVTDQLFLLSTCMLINLDWKMWIWQKQVCIKLNLPFLNPWSFISLNLLKRPSHLRVKTWAVKYHTTPYFPAQHGVWLTDNLTAVSILAGRLSS